MLIRTAAQLIFDWDPALDRELGKGGEGTVYAVRNHPQLALKTYSSAPAEKIQKLKALITLCKGLPGERVAWPLDYVEPTPEQALPFEFGIIFRKIEGVKIFNVYHYEERRKLPHNTFKFCAEVALSVGRALKEIHDHNFVVGDFNESNILVNPTTGGVTFIDVDSFQFLDPVLHKQYFCSVGKPEYTAPELQGVLFDQTLRTRSSDIFAFSALLFRLLFNGRSPHGTTNGPTEVSDAVKQGFYVYKTGYQLQDVPKHLSPITIISQELSNLFRQAFCTQLRPSIDAYIKTLDTFIVNLRACDISKTHFFNKDLQKCPWCGTMGLPYDIYQDPSDAHLVPQIPAGSFARHPQQRLWKTQLDQIDQYLNNPVPPAKLITNTLIPQIPPRRIHFPKVYPVAFFLFSMSILSYVLHFDCISGSLAFVGLIYFCTRKNPAYVQLDVATRKELAEQSKLLVVKEPELSTLQAQCVALSTRFQSLSTQFKQIENALTVYADRLNELREKSYLTSVKLDALPEDLINPELKPTLIAQGIRSAGDIQAKATTMPSDIQELLMIWKNTLLQSPACKHFQPAMTQRRTLLTTIQAENKQAEEEIAKSLPQLMFDIEDHRQLCTKLQTEIGNIRSKINYNKIVQKRLNPSLTLT